MLAECNAWQQETAQLPAQLPRLPRGFMARSAVLAAVKAKLAETKAGCGRVRQGPLKKDVTCVGI